MARQKSQHPFQIASGVAVRVARDILRRADTDHLIDLGPEGGEEGGEVVAVGTPEEVAAVKGSYTGRFLAELVEPAKPKRASRKRREPVAA